jgi:hypothetical protein
LYLFGRLGWNASQDVTALESEYYSRCYGKAADAIKQTEARLSGEGVSETVLVGEMRNLKERTAKINLDSAQHLRLVNYKAYLHYLKLLDELQHSNGEKANACSDKLMEFVYGTFYRMMVHVMPLSDYLKNRGPNQSYIRASWDYTKPTAEGMKFAKVVQLRDAEIEQQFDADCKKGK